MVRFLFNSYFYVIKNMLFCIIMVFSPFDCIATGKYRIKHATNQIDGSANKEYILPFFLRSLLKCLKLDIFLLII